MSIILLFTILIGNCGQVWNFDRTLVLTFDKVLSMDSEEGAHEQGKKMSHFGGEPTDPKVRFLLRLKRSSKNRNFQLTLVDLS